jgi:hypothetical protein
MSSTAESWGENVRKLDLPALKEFGVGGYLITTETKL